MKAYIGSAERESPPLRGMNPWLRRIVVIIALFALLQSLVALGLFNQTNLAFYDWAFRVKGSNDPGNDVVIIALDDASLEKLGPPPLPRAMHARLLSHLDEASVVAFNMTFDSSLDQKQDELFGTAIKKHGKVILACVMTFSEGQNGRIQERVNLPAGPLLRNAANIGFLNIPTDNDSVVRRTTLIDVNLSPGHPVPSFGLAAVSTVINVTSWKVNDHILKLAADNIYMDGSNRALFNYWGPAGTIPAVSYADVISGRIAPDFFAKKIVLVGYTGGSAAQDVFSTPFRPFRLSVGEGLMPGVEIQASIIKSLLNEKMYQEMSPWLEAGLLLLAILIGALLAIRRRPLQRLLLVPIMMIVVLVLLFGLGWCGWVFYPVAPLVGIALSLLLSK